MTYKLHENKDYNGNVTETYIIDKTRGCLIPQDTDNTDYKEYLKWVSEGNTAEAAD